MKFSKKVTISLLTTSFLLGNTAALDLNTLVKPNYTQAAEVLSNENTSDDFSFNNEDSVKIIVKLKENPVDPASLATEEGIAARQEATKPVREKALEKISDADIDYTKLLEYDLLFNGFSLETSYENAKKIQNLDFVESVELNVTYSEPTTPAATADENSTTIDYTSGKTLIDSNKLINIEPLWNKNIMGQGMVVSVIDSGLDLEHDILRISDPSKAKYKNKEAMDAALKENGINYGKWYSDKVIYAYNYADLNDQIKESKEESHGMHVAGTAVGNPSKPAANGELITGVAPEAQLMFMRVFSDDIQPGSTDSYIYVKAIEDSVKLGADVINMSLGGATGSTTDIGKGVAGAIELAKNMGVTVVIAAGNDNVFGDSYDTPRASNPDYGLVANPSVSYDALSVAALNNTVINTELLKVKQLAAYEQYNNGAFEISSPSHPFDPTIDYKYEYVNLGTTDDFKDKDLTGKIALIQRGKITFGEKVFNAKAAKAAGVVIFNHADGGDTTIGMNLGHNGVDQGKDFPVTSIGHSIGNLLSQHADELTLTFDGSMSKFANPAADTLTGFSSWGLSNDGNLKPDVTAPGGYIYSSINNGKYANMNGTSMASPHTAGAVALVKQSIIQRFPEVKGAELQKLMKHLIMSTALPNFDKAANAYTSPRRQGAGVIDTYRATTTDLYLTGDNDYSSIVLGNVDETFEFNVHIHNLSNTEKELTYVTHLNTDAVENEEFTLKPKELGKIPGDRIVVPANSTLTVPIKITSSIYTDDLTKTMPNGYYLEGFVRFVDSKDSADVISIPYVAFKGNFQDLPVLEKPIYEFSDEEKPFYYYTNPNAENKEVDKANHFTSLVTISQELDPLTYSTVPAIKVVGEYPDYENLDWTKSVLKKDKLVFSPNGDKHRDEIGLKGVFLRNYENLQLNVYKVDDTNREHAIYSGPFTSGRKNFFGGRFAKSNIIDATTWNGKDSNGNLVPDGKYQFVVSYKPDTAGAKTQETAFIVETDTAMPIISGGYYDEKTRTFHPHKIIEKGSGLAFEGVIYDDDHTDSSNFLKANKDGSYTIPEGKELKDYWIRVADYAGNEDSQRLDLINTGNNGLVNISLFVDNFTTDYNVYGRYKIFNEKGEVVYAEKESRIVGVDESNNILRKNLHKLPFGKYTVEATLVLDDLELVSPRQVTFTLDKDNSFANVVFKTKEIFQNKLSIRFDKILPPGSKVFAIDPDGNKVELPRSQYVNTVYEKKLANKEYTVIVELPAGYVASENNFIYTVKNGDNIKQLTFEKVSKYQLEAELAKVLETKAQDSYIYDSQEDKDAYEEALKEALEVLANSQASQKEVDSATEKLEKIRSAFDGVVPPTPLNKEALEAELAKVKEVTASDEFIYDDAEEKVSYEEAIWEANALLANEDATQEDLDNLAEKLAKLRAAFDGVKPTPVNKEKLQAELDKVVAVQESDAYTYDSNEDKEKYVTAIEEANFILLNEEATQDDVDALVKKLADLRTEFNGVAPQFSDTFTKDNFVTKFTNPILDIYNLVVNEINDSNIKDLVAKELNNDKVIFKIFDINMAKGEEVTKVDGERTVTVDLPEFKNKDVLVYHLTDNNELVALPTSIIDGKVVFSTLHFSNFVITATDSKEAVVTTVTTIIPDTEDNNSEKIDNEKENNITNSPEKDTSNTEDNNEKQKEDKTSDKVDSGINNKAGANTSPSNSTNVSTVTKKPGKGFVSSITGLTVRDNSNVSTLAEAAAKEKQNSSVITGTKDSTKAGTNTGSGIKALAKTGLATTNYAAIIIVSLLAITLTLFNRRNKNNKQ